MLIHDPGQERPVNELWVYLAVDSNGNEGICGMPLLGTTLPMVFGYERVALKFTFTAEQIAKASGKAVKLVKFTGREDIQTFEGK